MDKIKIVDINEENVHEYGLCGYKSPKKPGFPEKVDWMKQRLKDDLVIKTLVTENDGAQGMIEYLPGEKCWRSVHAENYLFIHCLFVGFKKVYQNQGYASKLIEACIDDAEKQNKSGVCVVTRKGSFMVDKPIFLKHGFEVVAKTAPDFELLVRKFDPAAPNPVFKENRDLVSEKFKTGLTIIRSHQCPYTVKNVNEICETAKNTFGLTPKVITIDNYQDAQNNYPCAVGNFTILYNGEILIEHPISKGRFNNIMKKLEL